MAAPAKSSPKDAQVMSAILKDMGVPEYEPRLINQMLEFTYRYVTDVLDDAKVYSSHANHKNIDADDIKMAVQMKMDHSFTSPPPRDLLMEIARQKNSQALPLIRPYCGPRLPPDRYCLSAPNYKLRAMKKPRLAYNLPVGQRLGMGTQVKSIASPSLTVVSKSLSQPTVTILNKQGPAQGGSTGGVASKTPSGTPKPLVRVNPAIGASGLTRIIGAGGTASVLQPSGLSSSSSASSLLSSSPASALPLLQSQAPASTSVLTVNPLKRKFEDDDYDNV